MLVVVEIMSIHTGFFLAGKIALKGVLWIGWLAELQDAENFFLLLPVGCKCTQFYVSTRFSFPFFFFFPSNFFVFCLVLLLSVTERKFCLKRRSCCRCRCFLFRFSFFPYNITHWFKKIIFTWRPSDFLFFFFFC